MTFPKQFFGNTENTSNVVNEYTTHDGQYLNFLYDITVNGRVKTDRTGTGTISVFGREMRFDIRNGVVPILTTKKIHLPAIFHEIIWYLSGTGNIKYLQDNGVRIWNEWADANGDLGPVYGYQWRNWPKYNIEDWDNPSDEPLCYVDVEKIDQIAQLIDDLKHNPESRRLMVNAWNVSDLPDMKLPPCHYTFQFYTELMTHREREWWYAAEQNTPGATYSELDLDDAEVPRRYLSCKITQRSADAFLGVPFNIAQYSILTHMIAQVVGMAAKDLIWSGGDCHIYSNHMDQVKEQLARDPLPSPILLLNKSVDNIDDFTYNDFSVKDYQSHPTIKATVAV